MSNKAELIVEGKKLAVSNLDKVLYPKAGFTKGQLIDYYIRIAPVLLPHLKDRPLTMKRYPNGVDQPFFYEKNCPSHRPSWVKTAKVWSEGNQRDMHYCLAQDLPTLVWAANLADIELHTSLARKKDVARPTMMVFDLDPGAPADIVQCCQVGLWLRDLLAGMKLKSWAKTSGSKGLQVYVPLNTAVTFDQTKNLSRALGGTSGARTSETGRLENGEGVADGKGVRGLESERRTQDDDQRLLAASEGTADRFHACHLGGSRRDPEEEKRKASRLHLRSRPAARGEAGRFVCAGGQPQAKNPEEMGSVAAIDDRGYLLMV